MHRWFCRFLLENMSESWHSFWSIYALTNHKWIKRKFMNKTCILGENLFHPTPLLFSYSCFLPLMIREMMVMMTVGDDDTYWFHVVDRILHGIVSALSYIVAPHSLRCMSLSSSSLVFSKSSSGSESKPPRCIFIHSVSLQAFIIALLYPYTIYLDPPGPIKFSWTHRVQLKNR